MFRIGTIIIFTLMLCCASSIATAKNGFDLSNSLIPAEKIMHGGPGRDGIPSIDQPRFIKAENAGFLEKNDRVLAINYKGIQRAYPIRILNWHEIVNDVIKDEAVIVTYCPLCGTGLIYSGEINGKHHQFGVSGLLYNSDVLLYDRQTESLWSQILSQALSGKMAGANLSTLPVEHTTWEIWRKQHPDTEVLSTQTGFERDYSRSPYAGYENNESIYFPLNANSRRYHPKERVLGIQVGEHFKAYPFTELAKSGKNPLSDILAGKALTVEFDVESRSGRILDETGNPLHAINSFWFAWYAFHPDTGVYVPK